MVTAAEASNAAVHEAMDFPFPIDPEDAGYALDALDEALPTTRESSMSLAMEAMEATDDLTDEMMSEINPMLGGWQRVAVATAPVHEVSETLFSESAR